MPRVPNYERVAADIRRQIEAGELKPGDELPSTRKLQEHYGVGNNAVYMAVTLLTREGLIEGHQGKARYVVDRS
ncbi:winged helix-turn-helix domain-containing protein [Catenuloplanes japonicus]|uniref:winged helix-turn-helix domain-containing protein n=1 Tax=Catenuloplanes japonicus TaxID=33876 RepID=UPI000525333B|nr:winged helix-turn-helix domain-containing protein [Catenuloplanes japonicus]